MDNVQEMTPEQTDKLLQFQDLTGIEPIQRCLEILDSHEWNIEAAVQDTFNEREGAPMVFHRPPHQEERAPQAALLPANQRVFMYTGRRPHSVFEWIYCLLTVPVHFVWTTAFNILQAFFGFFRPGPRRYVTDSSNDVQDSVGDVTSFISSFQSRYGLHHPIFYQGTYSQALNDAKRELRFLLVYLHREDHKNTEQFCREVLCNETFITFINSRMLFWACSTSMPEGSRVYQTLRERGYPFLVVIVPRDSTMSVVARIEGHITDPQQLTEQLDQVMAENEALLVVTRAQRAERSFNQFLRLQQDEDYLESLQADRQKEKLKMEAKEQWVKEESRKQQEIEEKELQFLEKEQQKSQMERQLPPEPELEHPDSIRIVLKVPSGGRIERRFLRNQSLKWLFYYVYSHKDCPDDFQILTNFPRKPLPCEPRDGQRDPPSFQEVGLGKSEMLFVHDNMA